MPADQSPEAKNAAIAELRANHPDVHFDTAWQMLRYNPAFNPENPDERNYIIQNYLTVEPPVEPEPEPAPTITGLNPSTAAAGADVTVDIAGTGFNPGATVNIGVAHSLVPTNITPTDLSVVFSGTAHIEFPGTLPVSVENIDGQVSNTLDFIAT
jgi:hypothetical protein